MSGANAAITDGTTDFGLRASRFLVEPAIAGSTGRERTSVIERHDDRPAARALELPHATLVAVLLLEALGEPTGSQPACSKATDALLRDYFAVRDTHDARNSRSGDVTDVSSL
jgi:hypothetical protein